MSTTEHTPDQLHAMLATPSVPAKRSRVVVVVALLAVAFGLAVVGLLVGKYVMDQRAAVDYMRTGMTDPYKGTWQTDPSR